MISSAKSSNAKWGFKWSTVALHKEAPGETGENTLLHKISKDFRADNVLEFKKKKKKRSCITAAGTPKGSEPSLKLKQFYKSTQHMHQLSSCALKWKINDDDRKPANRHRALSAGF